jgi:hypothetical protein
MEFVTNRITICSLAALLSLGTGRTAAAQMADTARASDTTAIVYVEPVTRTVYRAKAPAEPPAARPETKGTAPSAKAVWVPGFWDLQGDRNTGTRAGWVWVSGQWIEPPVPHAKWDPGHWGWSDDWYSWIPAHWVVPGRHGYPPELQSDEMTDHEMSAP